MTIKEQVDFLTKQAQKEFAAGDEETARFLLECSYTMFSFWQQAKSEIMITYEDFRNSHGIDFSDTWPLD